MSIQLLIAASIGLSIDVLIAVAYQGALLAKVTKKDLLVTAAVFAAWQFAAYAIGTLITEIPLFIEQTDNLTDAWDKIAAILFLMIGIQMIFKAVNRKLFIEKRMDIRFKKMNMLALTTSVDVLLAGVGFGFLQVPFWEELLILETVTIACVVGGMYFGYRQGFRRSKKIYWIGAMILLFTGVDILVRLV